MKIETPQILWHATDDGKAAPLLSLSILPILLQATVTNDNEQLGQQQQQQQQHVMATSGNTPEVNLWKLSSTLSTSSSSVQPQHILSLTRNHRCTNTLAFSPNGSILATAGDGGSILLYSIPISSNSSSSSPSPARPSTATNSKSKLDFWLHLEKESDLHCHIIKSSPSEDVMDISWDRDSKRFVVGCMDHEILVYEEFATATATATPPSNSNNNMDGSSAINPSDKEWKCIWRQRDHVSYVQGVAWDPLGVYLASQGSDRTIKVYTRKHSNATNSSNNIPNGKIELMDMTKAKTVKYQTCDDANSSPNSLSTSPSSTPMETTTATTTVSESSATTSTMKKRCLFAEESTVESFFRRLSWTPDGAFLVTPTALWHGTDPDNSMENAVAVADSSEVSKEDEPSPCASPPSFATCLFARHRFDRPAVVLSGLDKPSVAVKSNPIRFCHPQLESVNGFSTPDVEMSKFLIPYRTYFAVLTLDTVIIYDTNRFKPLAMARGLHYAGLTDCEWTNDGRHLLVTSSDGYISILSFEDGELGQVYSSNETVTTDTFSLDDPFHDTSTTVIEDENPKTVDETKNEEEEDHVCILLAKPTTPKPDVSDIATPVPQIKMMVVKKKEKKKKRIALTQVITTPLNEARNGADARNDSEIEKKKVRISQEEDSTRNVTMVDVRTSDISTLDSSEESKCVSEDGITKATTATIVADSSKFFQTVSTEKKSKKKRIQPIQIS